MVPPTIPLTVEMSAAEALRSILLVQLNQIEYRLPKVLEDRDPRHLHKFRVALRRSRSALKQLKNLFPRKQLKPHRLQLTHLMKLSNPVRDFDVFLLDANDLRILLPKEKQGDLDFFFGKVRLERDKAFKTLAGSLTSVETGEALHRWRRYLTEEAGSKGHRTKKGRRPVARIAHKRLHRQLETVTRGLTSCTEATPEAEVHSLRIECKKLRYLLEFFTPLFPKEEVEECIQQVKQLQNNLGAFNDRCVQLAFVESYLNPYSTHGNPSREDRDTLYALAVALHQKREQEKSAFLLTSKCYLAEKCWKPFENLIDTLQH